MPVGPMLVSDNAANMIKAGKLLQCHLHIGCFAHTINLAVQRALKVAEVGSILGRIRRLVSFFHRSTFAASLLKEQSQLLGLRPKKLKMNVPTRWNSAFDMLARYLELQGAVTAVIRSKELSRLKERDIFSLTDEEVAAADDLMSFLKP